MPAFLAILATFVLGCLAVLQAMLALGAPFGEFAWGGKHRVLPARLRVGSALSIVAYAVIACVLLSRVELIGLMRGTFVVVAAWVAFAFFVIGIVLNLFSSSKQERYTMTAINVVLAVCALDVALS